MSAALAGRIRRHLEPQKATEQKMFGGICFMVGGNMAVCASRNGLLVRVGPDGMADALHRPGARRMIMGERTMTGYVYVADDAIATDRALARWISTALGYVAMLPAKKQPKPRIAAQRRRVAK
jgi:TfoX/Sxy family transcriptional regulator of competence genes